MSIGTYVVDDGSEDGTSEAVLQTIPETHLIAGSGNLYWGGGMRLAFKEAMKDGWDFYLLLNDDVILKPSAIEILLATFEDKNPSGNKAPITSIAANAIFKASPISPIK